MKNKYNTRGFAKFKGKTIQSVNTTVINSVKFRFTDGTTAEISADDLHYGIPVIASPTPKKK